MPFERAFAIKLMEHLVVPTFVLDNQRRVIIWNRACERLTGLAAADVLGTSDHWKGFYDSPRHCLADVLALGQTGKRLLHLGISGDPLRGLKWGRA